ACRLHPHALGREADVAVRKPRLGPTGRKPASVVLDDEDECAVAFGERDCPLGRVRVPNDVREKLPRGGEDELILLVPAGAVQVEPKTQSSAGGGLPRDGAERGLEPCRLE